MEGNMTLFKKIQDQLDTLSDAKKNVALYILDNWVEVAFVPASKVARSAKVSESVVVRFCQDLGFSGFPELQNKLQTILKSRLTNPEATISNNVKNNNGLDGKIKKIYKKTIENLEDVCNKNTNESFIKFVNKIEDADRILILARKNSFGPAHLLNLHLNEIFTKSVVMNGESVEALDYIRGFTSNDLVIFISIPSYSKRMSYYSDYMKEKNIPQIAITNSRENRMAQNADIVLFTSVDSLTLFNSHLSTIFIIDVILYLLTNRNKSELLKHLEEIKVLNERFGIAD